MLKFENHCFSQCARGQKFTMDCTFCFPEKPSQDCCCHQGKWEEDGSLIRENYPFLGLLTRTRGSEFALSSARRETREVSKDFFFNLRQILQAQNCGRGLQEAGLCQEMLAQLPQEHGHVFCRALVVYWPAVTAHFCCCQQACFQKCLLSLICTGKSLC